jgi:hypothetical protein
MSSSQLRDDFVKGPEDFLKKCALICRWSAEFAPGILWRVRFLNVRRPGESMPLQILGTAAVRISVDVKPDLNFPLIDFRLARE